MVKSAGGLRLTVLGFGGWLSDPAFGQSAYLLECGGIRILMDCGEGCVEGLRSCCSLDVTDLTAVLITHAHGDHVLGLPTLLQRAKHAGVRLTVAALPEVLDSIKELLKALQIPEYFDYVNEVPLKYGAEVSLAGFSVKAFRAEHKVPSASLAVRVCGKLVAYSGDSWPNDEFLKGVEGADLLIHEVSMPYGLVDVARECGHTPAELVGHVVSVARPKVFMPTHYYVSPPAIEADSLAGCSVIMPAKCLKVWL